MTPLIESQWATLRHAYGGASDIPGLIQRLEAFPNEDDYQNEPFFTLWSALCHQGDSYNASYAAVPHIVRITKTNPGRASLSYFALPTAIEVSRARGLGDDISADAETDYFCALKELGKIAESELLRNPEKFRRRYLSAAVAIGEGVIDRADDILNEED